MCKSKSLKFWAHWIFKLRSSFFSQTTSWIQLVQWVQTPNFSNLGGVWCTPAAARWEDWKIHLPGHAGVVGCGRHVSHVLNPPEVMPPELAAAALEAFYEAEDGRLESWWCWSISIVHISSFSRDGNFQVWPAACADDVLHSSASKRCCSYMYSTCQWASQFTALGRSWKRMKYPLKGQSKGPKQVSSFGRRHANC